ncbi:hypothetical protein NKJ90_13230 [Mesorhizobium sp. M0051]|uniref:hypothetical protein n=1 Tax=Mesorhizobium sp. M0051 TaxID=2956862 RepID=UPI003335DF39
MRSLFPAFVVAVAATSAVAAPSTYVNERFGTVCTFLTRFSPIASPSRTMATDRHG